ncbi:MAG: hypothetical protein JO042_17560 [Sinobacteraceae bacterium]|nr:hypothetical protein [Nevskiaceae bacterium]
MRRSDGGFTNMASVCPVHFTIPTVVLMLRQQKLQGLIVGSRKHQVDMIRDRRKWHQACVPIALKGGGLAPGWVKGVSPIGIETHHLTGPHLTMRKY